MLSVKKQASLKNASEFKTRRLPAEQAGLSVPTVILMGRLIS